MFKWEHMQLKYRIKKAIMQRVLQKRKRAQVFDSEYAELFQIPADAGSDFNNSYYFSAHHLEGQSLFLRLGLRGDKQSEIWFVYRDKNMFYSCPVQLCNTVDSPLQVECVEVGKQWKMSFKGQIQSMDNKEDIREAVFEGLFTATAPIFDFFYHANPEPIASAFAKEKWNTSFFEEVQKNNQTHYEQAGHISGRISIGNEEKQIDMVAIRDHSFGKRDWNYMNKHMWLMALTDNGDALNLSMVSYPAIKGIQVGNYIREAKSISVLQFKSTDDLINSGRGADVFNLEAVLENGEKLIITVNRDVEVVYSFANNQYILREGMGDFTVNGNRARGIIEFGFNKDSDRW